MELIDLVKSGGIDLEKIVTNTTSGRTRRRRLRSFSANAGKNAESCTRLYLKNRYAAVK